MLLRVNSASELLRLVGAAGVLADLLLFEGDAGDLEGFDGTGLLVGEQAAEGGVADLVLMGLDDGDFVGADELDGGGLGIIGRFGRLGRRSTVAHCYRRRDQRASKGSEAGAGESGDHRPLSILLSRLAGFQRVLPPCVADASR